MDKRRRQYHWGRNPSSLAIKLSTIPTCNIFYGQLDREDGGGDGMPISTVSESLGTRLIPGSLSRQLSVNLTGSQYQRVKFP